MLFSHVKVMVVWWKALLLVVLFSYVKIMVIWKCLYGKCFWPFEKELV